MNSISIAQITDIHIAEEGRLPNGVDVRANFLKVLKEVKKAKVDYMVVSGDLCCDVGIIEVYEWVKSHLDAVEVPYFILSGNHDDPTMMAAVFGLDHLLQNGELYFSHRIEGIGQFVFLDSTTGKVSPQQLDFLTDCCKDVNEPQLLFVHHPPTLASVAHMDKNYSLKNITEVQTVIEGCVSKPQAIFCGHYHCERSISLPDLGTTVFITPSSAYFQINPNSSSFEIGAFRSAWRKIIWDGKTVKSTIEYVGSAAKSMKIVKQYYKAWETGNQSLLPLADDVQHRSPDAFYESKAEFLKACWDDLKGSPTPIVDMMAEENRVCVWIETPIADEIMSVCAWFDVEKELITNIRVLY